MRKRYFKMTKRWRRSKNSCVGFGLSDTKTTLGESITEREAITQAESGDSGSRDGVVNETRLPPVKDR